MDELPVAPAALEAMLLGTVGFGSLVDWQRRMVYEVGGDRSRGILALCETAPTITVGRAGSRQHILLTDAELKQRGWSIRWVNRGGGCMLHVSGQLQVISVMALDSLGLGVLAYLEMLHDIVLNVCHESDVACQLIPNRAGVWAGDRMLAQIGIAVHEWVAYFGATINMDPDLEPFRDIHCDGWTRPMTSLARERRAPIRAASVRQRLVELFADRFGFQRTAIFHRHHALASIPFRHGLAHQSA